MRHSSHEFQHKSYSGKFHTSRDDLSVNNNTEIQAEEIVTYGNGELTALYILCLGLLGVMEALLYICETKEMASVTSESYHDVNNTSLATNQTDSFRPFNGL